MINQKIILKKGEEIRIKEGHPWVFSNEVKQIEGTIKSGELINVYSSNLEYLGCGFLNTASKIIVRMLDKKEITINYEFFFERIKKANDYRVSIGFDDNYRVVFGEADMLPGLIIDKYAKYIVIQVLSLGMDIYKDLIIKALVEIFNPIAIVERSDVAIRKKEGLEEYKGVVYGHLENNIVTICENDILLNVDIMEGQKTGYFLDQKTNRKSLERYVNNKRVLDCFSHTGGFGLHAKKYGASSVVCVDISQKACNDILTNARLNNFNDVEVVCQDVFDYLRDKQNFGKFDVIILDPPAFTKSKDTVEKAYKGYKEINMSALKLLKPNGILYTFSCSQHMTPAIFLEMLKDASIDASVNVQMIDFKVQSPDHPTRLGSDESLYLKCVVLRVL